MGTDFRNRVASGAAMANQRHALIAESANGRGMFLAECRCGHRAYGSSPEIARNRLAEHLAFVGAG